MPRDEISSAKSPTMIEVARHAGVSTATVSRCLNSPERVAEETRERVMNAVTSLGYSPNFGAQVMAAKRTNTIGAIIPTMENAIFARGLQAFQEELERQGVTLLVASSSYRADLEEQQIRKLVARGADGLLVIGLQRDPKIYRFLAQHGVPTVAAWVCDPYAEIVSIGFDNRAAMEDLATTVIDAGHRRIGVVTAEQSNNDRARERVAGIRVAMKRAGLRDADLSIVETVYGIDAGANAFAELMDLPEPPTAVMCGNDVLAAGAVNRAKEMNLAVPGDVSVTGFDDIELAKIVSPALTTVHVPHRRMGAEAAKALVGLVQKDSQVRSVRIETSVCLRGSLGPPKAPP